MNPSQSRNSNMPQGEMYSEYGDMPYPAEETSLGQRTGKILANIRQRNYDDVVRHCQAFVEAVQHSGPEQMTDDAKAVLKEKKENLLIEATKQENSMRLQADASQTGTDAEEATKIFHYTREFFNQLLDMDQTFISNDIVDEHKRTPLFYASAKSIDVLKSLNQKNDSNLEADVKDENEITPLENFIIRVRDASANQKSLEFESFQEFCKSYDGDLKRMWNSEYAQKVLNLAGDLDGQLKNDVLAELSSHGLVSVGSSF